MSEITEVDGELLIDGRPTDYCAAWETEAAIRQLRAELTDWNNLFAAVVGQSLPGAPSLWPFNGGQDPAMVAFSLHQQSERTERAEAELARLRAQGPVAWMWNDMIGIPHTHISPTRPTWPDAGASSAMSVAINVRPLYAEPMPAKVAK